MMQPKQKTPAEIAAEKNNDVMRVLAAHKNALCTSTGGRPPPPRPGLG